MADIEWLTYDMFAARVGEGFDATAGDGEVVPLVLDEATESEHLGGRGPEGQERRQFSLVFRGPATGMLPQGTYSLAHAELGELELFLVPIRADVDGVSYEAAFA